MCAVPSTSIAFMVLPLLPLASAVPQLVHDLVVVTSVEHLKNQHDMARVVRTVRAAKALRTLRMVVAMRHVALQDAIAAVCLVHSSHSWRLPDTHIIKF